MAIRDPICSKLSFQKETTFNGASAEGVLKWRGRITATSSVQHGQGRKRQSIWGAEIAEDRFGIHWEGRIEWELSANELIDQVLDQFFDIKSETTDLPAVGYTTIVYRPKRIATVGSFKLGWEHEGDGPNYIYGGCIFTRLNIRVDLNQTVRVSANFMAASKSGFPNAESSSYSGSSVGETNPFESQYLEGPDLPSSEALSVGAVDVEQGVIARLGAAATWAGAAIKNATSINIQFGRDHRAARYTESGAVGRWEPRGQFEAAFGVTRYGDENDDMLTDAEAKLVLPFGVTLTEDEDSTRSITIDWPRTEIRTADDPILQGFTDLPTTFALTGLQESALNISSEPTVTVARKT